MKTALVKRNGKASKPADVNPQEMIDKGLAYLKRAAEGEFAIAGLHLQLEHAAYDSAVPERVRKLIEAVNHRDLWRPYRGDAALAMYRLACVALGQEVTAFEGVPVSHDDIENGYNEAWAAFRRASGSMADGPARCVVDNVRDLISHFAAMANERMGELTSQEYYLPK